MSSVAVARFTLLLSTPGSRPVTLSTEAEQATQVMPVILYRFLSVNHIHPVYFITLLSFPQPRRIFDMKTEIAYNNTL